MSRLSLSNLSVRANLLSREYQSEYDCCSVFELRDIDRRNERLDVMVRLSPAHREEWRSSLEWGTRLRPQLNPRWPEGLAQTLRDDLPRLEQRPDLEAVFEALVVARQLYAVRPTGPAQDEAADWDRRLCALLTGRHEFRLTRELIDDRLEQVIGERLPGPPDPVLPEIAAPQPTPIGEELPTPSAVIPAHREETPPPTPTAPIPPPAPEAAPVPSAAPPIEFVVAPPAEDPDLVRLTARWPHLPDAVRTCILLLVDAADRTAQPRT